MASFEEVYPHIAQWIDEWGWIEIGNDGMSSSLIRALNGGGLIWENTLEYTSLDEALKALDEALGKWFAENL